MPERPGYVPESETRVTPERPRRHAIGPELMRLASELKVVDRSLAKRAEGMVRNGMVQKYLMPKVEWKDPEARHPSPKNRLDVLCIGSGKGHEAVEILMTVPGSEVTLVDPHDGHTETVKEMIRTLSDESKELPETVPGEDLREVDDASMDGIAMNFVLHDMNGAERRDAALEEAKRVLKDDGYLFVAEDLGETAAMAKKAARADRLINLEVIKRGEKMVESQKRWIDLFERNGFEVMETKDEYEGIEEDLAKGSPHIFFVLRKRREEAK